MIEHDEAAKLANVVLGLRQKRSRHLPPEMFGERSWDLLLILFIADAAGERLTASIACARVGGSPLVAERWLKVLERFDLATCENRCDDGNVVSLTPKGIDAVEACMQDAKESMHRLTVYSDPDAAV